MRVRSYRFLRVNHTRLVSAGLMLLLLLTACSATVQPYAVNVRQMGTCAGWDSEEQKPLNVKDVFGAEDGRIYMYAYIETTQKLFFQTVWSFEGRTAWRQVGEHGTGYLYTYVEPAEGKSFPAGDYEVHLVLGRTILREAKFRVVESDQ